MEIDAGEERIMAAIAAADDAGIRLEVIQGLPVWEFFPSPIHTIDAQRIYDSIRSTEKSSTADCGCYRFQDMTIRFPDGSIRRPDIAIFCRMPERTREATRLLPEAVIELVSPGSEVKDLQVSPGFYLGQGVKDVIVYTPESGQITHFRRDAQSKHQTPTRLILECGCEVVV